MKPRSPYVDMMALARRLRSEGHFLQAAAAFGKAEQLQPDGVAGLFQALSLRDAGHVDEAISHLRKLLHVHPSHFDGWTSLGVLLKRERRYQEAITPLRKALSLREDIPTRNALVTCLWRSGKVEEAQTKGLENLERKHRLALETFNGTSGSKFRLKEGGKGFDPEQRSRNVIAFSLWGDRPEYITGAIVNAQIAQHIYVCWTPRFYCDVNVPADAREALVQYGAQVILMNRPEQARFRPMWRFLASDDPKVNVFVCRDADSRLNAKELLAVQDWLGSGKRFHVMRDHIYHMELVLAGMWGGMSGVLPDMQSWLLGAPEYFDNKFGDQAFLMNMVWPLIWQDACIHDSYYRFPDGGPFPPGYELPRQIHVGGSVKTMPHWSRYFGYDPKQ